MKQLALGCLNHESALQEFPYGRKYDIWDTYTWTQLVLPYVEENAIYDNYWTLPQKGYVTNYPGPNGPIGDDTRLRAARHTPIRVQYCPSDLGPVGNELETGPYGFMRGNYRGCVGSGDIYGYSVDATSGPWGLGTFGVIEGQSVDAGAAVATKGIRMKEIVDGTAKTLMLSEGLVPTVSGWGGALGETIYGNMGGALFSAALTPNSSSPDRVYAHCPQNVQDPAYKAPCLSIGGSAWWTPSAKGSYVAARSSHAGGVNVGYSDGSVKFATDGVDLAVWRSGGTRDGSEVISEP